MGARPWSYPVLVVVAATFLVHWGSLGGGQVYDDHRFIEHNAAIRSVPLVEAFSDPATASHGSGITHDIYRPLRTILFSLEYAVFAEQVVDRNGQERIDFHLRWWHFMSVLLHALNAVLVYFLLRPMLRAMLRARAVRGGEWFAAIGALVFALHPLTSESVAWLSSQGDLLAMTFGLAALLVLAAPGMKRTLLGAALFALACLAKESALVLPALLPLRDLALPRDDEQAPSPWARETWIRVGALTGVAALYFVLRLSLIPDLAQVAHPGGSVFATARGMASGLLWYLQALIWPFGFSFDTRIDVPYRWGDPAVVLGLGVLATTLAAGAYGLRRGHFVLAFATLGFLVLLGPVSNVVVPLKTFVADRFVYPGLICVGAGLAGALLTLRPTWRRAGVTVFCALLVGLGLLTAARNASWADEMTLWRAVAAERPENANAWQGIGYEYQRLSRTAEAELGYQSYLEANPDDGKVIKSLGDLMGMNAESLVQLPGGGGGELSTRRNRKRARAAQIAFYRQALRLWEQPGGLVRHRGSEDLRAQMLEHWIEAAVDLGDLRSAKFANDRAIDLEARGQGYTHADLEAVGTQSSWWRRRARVLLALRAVQVTQAREIPESRRVDVLTDRRELLQDVGLDPSRSADQLLYALRQRIDALIEEALTQPDFRPDVGLFVHRAHLLAREGGDAPAAQAIEEALRIYPNHPVLVDELRFFRR